MNYLNRGLAIGQSLFLVGIYFVMMLRGELLSRVKILGQALCLSRRKRRLAHGVVTPCIEDWGVVVGWGLYVLRFGAGDIQHRGQPRRLVRAGQ